MTLDEANNPIVSIAAGEIAKFDIEPAPYVRSVYARFTPDGSADTFWSDGATVKGRQVPVVSLPGHEDSTVVDEGQPIDVRIDLDASEGLVTLKDTTASGTRDIGSGTIAYDENIGTYGLSLSVRLTAGSHRLTAHFAGSA